MPKYGSKASCYQVIVRADEPILHPGSGKQIGKTKPLIAEFGYQAPEYDVLDINGDPMLDGGTGRAFGKAADIRGHFFDSEAYALEHGWTDDEHDQVVSRIEFVCREQPEMVWRLTEARATAPWKTYDTMHHNKIAAYAADGGTVSEALRYERQNKNRPSVIAALEAEAARPVVDESALTAA